MGRAVYRQQRKCLFNSVVFLQPPLPLAGSQHLLSAGPAAPQAAQRPAAEAADQVVFACLSWAADTASLTARRTWRQLLILRLSPGTAHHRQTQRQVQQPFLDQERGSHLNHRVVPKHPAATVMWC